jgi:F0F1-type ATP synthase membrane subunit c/vacuolar-type H+-ATPase subunit K
MTQRIMTARILWLALMTSVGLYVVVLRTIVIQTPTAPLQAFLPLVFGIVAFMAATASFLIPKNAMRRAILLLNLPLVEMKDPNARGAFAETVRSFAQPEEAARRAVAVFQTGLILALALSESVVLLGFVLGFLGYGSATAAPFFVAGALLMAIRFPTEAAIVRLLESSYGAKWLVTKAE